MSTFTLAISCLTTSNLPWFMDLTFQVPMQYCSLQHQTLLLSPVTSTAGYCFCFGSIPSFFLELFLHWSPVANDLGSSSFGILSFCIFILFMGFYYYIYYCGQEYLKRNGVAIMVNKRVQNAVLGCNLKMTEWSLFISKGNHSISQLSKSMPQPVMLKKLTLNGSMKTYKTF